MHPFSSCIWEDMLVPSAAIQTIFRYNHMHLCCLETITDSMLRIIVLISWATRQDELTCETFWISAWFQRTGERGAAVAPHFPTEVIWPLHHFHTNVLLWQFSNIEVIANYAGSFWIFQLSQNLNMFHFIWRCRVEATKSFKRIKLPIEKRVVVQQP